MSNINWEAWEQWAHEALALDTNLEGCKCENDCNCVYKDTIEWLRDVTRVRKFSPPSIIPVNKTGAIVLNEKGIIQGP